MRTGLCMRCGWDSRAPNGRWERELSQLAADGRRLMPGIYRAARVCGRAAAWDKPRSGQNAGAAHDAWR